MNKLKVYTPQILKTDGINHHEHYPILLVLML